MSRELIAAQSGWGKSWLAQYRIESNLDNFDFVLVADHEDEFRGIAKAGYAKWMGVSDREAAAFRPEEWALALQDNRRIIAARAVRSGRWKGVVSDMARAAELVDGDVLVVVDEAHFVAGQRDSVDDRIEGLATTGRGRGISSIWITQRLAKLHSTISSQCNRRALGGFVGSNDLDRVGSIVDYPSEVHNPQRDHVSRLPPEVEADDAGAVPVRETDPGSEWIYSTRDGERRRLDSSALSMDSTHHGPEGSQLNVPG